MPTDGRIGPHRVFLFGLGRSPGPGPDDGATRERFTDMARALIDAGAVEHAIGFPVEPGASPDAEQARAFDWARTWIEAVAQWRQDAERVVLLDEDGRLRAAADGLRERATALGLRWEA